MHREISIDGAVFEGIKSMELLEQGDCDVISAERNLDSEPHGVINSGCSESRSAGTS